MKEFIMLMLVAVFALAFSCCSGPAQTNEPLPSWNDGQARQAIIEFVKDVTTAGGALLSTSESFFNLGNCYARLQKYECRISA